MMVTIKTPGTNRPCDVLVDAQTPGAKRSFRLERRSQHCRTVSHPSAGEDAPQRMHPSPANRSLHMGPCRGASARQRAMHVRWGVLTPWRRRWASAGKKRRVAEVSYPVLDLARI